MADILVADDTRAIRNALVILLEEEGYKVRLASDGEEALAEYRRKRPDMLLLDVMMPKKNGYQVLKQIRRGDPALPIIFLSAKGSPADVSLGLDLGSDDYLPKPFDSEVLISRIKAVFRRSNQVAPQSAPAEAVPQNAGEDIKMRSHRVDVKRLVLVGPKGRTAALSLRELGLVRKLASQPGEVLLRDALLSDLWGLNFSGNTRVLDQTILKLRKKFGKDADCIETVHGIGYRYVP